MVQVKAVKAAEAAEVAVSAVAPAAVTAAVVNEAAAVKVEERPLPVRCRSDAEPVAQQWRAPPRSDVHPASLTQLCQAAVMLMRPEPRRQGRRVTSMLMGAEAPAAPAAAAVQGGARLARSALHALRHGKRA